MISPSHLLGSFRVKPLRGLARGALVAATLLALPTAVLAYADLLPDSFDLSALGLGTPTADLPHVARQIAAGEPLRIVAFGSSSTEGIGASSPAAAYPARLEVALKGALPHLAGGVTVLNRGIGGEHTDDMLRRLDRDVLQAKPQLVIWQTGSNDALRGVTLEHFREATIATVRQMQDAEIDVVLMGAAMVPQVRRHPRRLPLPRRRARDRR